MAQTTNSKSPDHPLLTMRVSRDGGRTWAATREIWPKDCGVPLASSVWPPCLCPRHRNGSEISR